MKSKRDFQIDKSSGFARECEVLVEMQTGKAGQCYLCSGRIEVDDLCFHVCEDYVDRLPTTWCRACIVRVLIAARIIDDRTAAAIPQRGPIPEWLRESPVLEWADTSEK